MHAVWSVCSLKILHRYQYSVKQFEVDQVEVLLCQIWIKMDYTWNLRKPQVSTSGEIFNEWQTITDDSHFDKLRT